MASPVPAPDTSSWPTQTEAAAVLATGERTIRRWIDAGRLRSALRPVTGRKPVVIVDPDDVEKLRGERMPVLIREDAASNDTGQIGLTASPASAPAPYVPAQAARFQHFLAGILQAYPVARPKPWLTLDEAAEFSGLPKAWLLAQARRDRDVPDNAAGSPDRSARPVLAINIGSEKRRVWRFNRAALEK